MKIQAFYKETGENIECWAHLNGTKHSYPLERGFKSNNPHVLSNFKAMLWEKNNQIEVEFIKV